MIYNMLCEEMNIIEFGLGSIRWQDEERAAFARIRLGIQGGRRKNRSKSFQPRKSGDVVYYVSLQRSVSAFLTLKVSPIQSWEEAEKQLRVAEGKQAGRVTESEKKKKSVEERGQRSREQRERKIWSIL